MTNLRATSLIPAVFLLAGNVFADHKPDTKAIERGKYLMRFAGCGDCHTPWKEDPETHAPIPDMSRMLSGHPEGAPDPEGKVGVHDIALIGPTFTSFTMPFGTVYSANLTPDPDTGIGSWTEEMFVKAIRTGKHMGGNGRPLLPPMLFMAMSVRTLNDQDLKSIYAYLRSIPPIRNAVPTPKVPEPVVEQMDHLRAGAFDAHPMNEAMAPADHKASKKEHHDKH